MDNGTILSRICFDMLTKRLIAAWLQYFTTSQQNVAITTCCKMSVSDNNIGNIVTVSIYPNYLRYVLVKCSKIDDMS